MRISKFIALTFLLLAACSQSGSQSAPQDSATFLAEPVSATVEEGNVNSTFSNIATSRLLNFSVCLRDVAVQEPVVGASFVVRDGAKEIPLKSSATDSKGCLYWSENFPFDSTAKETFYEISRTVEATSVHKGSITLKIAVNPWKKGADAVRDLRFQSAPTNSGGGGSVGLVVESVGAELEIVKSQDSVAEADLQLSFNPKVARTGLDGSTVLDSLTSGKFRLKAQLLANSPEGNFPLSPVAEIGEASLTKGVVQAKTRLKIERKIPREATIELGFEAIPVGGPEGLGSVKGKVSLGRLTSLSISKTAPLVPETGMSFFAAPSRESGGAAIFGFELGRVQVSDVVVKELDSTGKPRVVELELKGCLRNTISQEKILGQKFSVDFDEKNFSLSSDSEEGCLKWRQDFTFDYHARELFLKKTIVVNSANSFYGNEKAERTVYLDLWNYETPDKIALDEQFDGAPSPSVAETGAGSELILPSAYFNFMGRTFDIDSHLNLSTTRKYRFELQPKIRRMSRDKGWLPAQGTGNGRYLIRILLETNDRNQPEVIDAQEIKAESRADVITVTVGFHIDDIRLVNARTNISIEVLPQDRASALRTQPYIGTFDMVGGFSIRMEPRNGKIDERMKAAGRPNPALKETGLEIFRRTRKHPWLDDKTLAGINSSQKEFDAAVAGDESALGKLCGLFYNPNGWFSSYKSCTRDPKGYLSFVNTNFVRKVYETKLARLPETAEVNYSAGVNYSDYQSNDETSTRAQSYDLTSGVRLSVPLLDLIGLNIGTGVGVTDSWSTSKSLTKGKSKASNKSSGQSKELYVDQAEFNILADVDRCLIVTEKTAEKDNKVYMGCASRPEKKTVAETYYLIYQPIGPSSLIDTGASLEERPFLSLVRGTDRFQNFVKLLQDPEVTFNLSHSLPAPADVMREAEGRYDGFFPGLLTIEQ